MAEAARRRNAKFIMGGRGFQPSEVTPLLDGDHSEMGTTAERRRGVHPLDGEGKPSPQYGDHVTFNTDTLANRLKHGFTQVIQNLTLEPMLFMKMLAESNLVVVADTLEIDRVCRVNLNYTEEECVNMDDGNHTDLQAEVQRYQNLFNYYQNLMDSILPLIVVILIGSLTDKYGRKPPMLIILAGFVCSALMNVITALHPTWPVEVLFISTLSVDITGTWVVFNMAVYSYMADITSPETRTKRMGFLDVVWYLGDPLGRLMGGWLYRWSGFVTVFSVSAVLWALCFLYVLFLVRESVDTTARSSGAQETRYAQWGPFKHIVILFSTAFRQRAGNRRLLLLSLLGVKLMVFLTQGHQMYLWARRVLQWGATQFSTWTSLDSLVHMSGTVVWLLLASRFKLHETLIAIGGLVSQGMWCAVLACITGPIVWWLVIVATTVGMFEQTIEPAIRTMLTVVVDKNEAGKVLALNGLLEAAWLTVDRTIYTSLYNTYVETFPQINFVVQAGFCIVLTLVFLVLLSIFRNQPPSTPTRRKVHNFVGDANQEHSRDTHRGYIY